MLSILTPILTILFIAVCYGLAGVALLLITLAIKTRRFGTIRSAAISVVAPAVLIGIASGGGIGWMFAIGLGCLVAMAGAYRFAIVPRMDWQTLKLAN